jgi:hypothetical protein
MTMITVNLKRVRLLAVIAFFCTQFAYTPFILNSSGLSVEICSDLLLKTLYNVLRNVVARWIS